MRPLAAFLLLACFPLGYGLGTLLKGTPVPSFGAQPVLTAFQGGTGTTSPSGILYGDSTIRVKTVIIGSNLTFSGGTLSSTDTSFSTTSASYFTSLGLAFSTTSALAHLVTIDKGFFFSTTSTNYYHHASTTVPTMYKNNIWTGTNTFPFGYLGANNGLGSTSPSTMWQNSIASSTLFAGRTNFLIASSTTAGATELIDFSTSNVSRKILSQNTGFVMNSTSSSPGQADGFFAVFVCQDNTGSWVPTWLTPGQIVWGPSGTPTAATGANTMSRFLFEYQARVSRFSFLDLATSSDTRSCQP